MGKVRLKEIAWGKAGDKGDKFNINVIAKNKEFYKLIEEQLTPERVKELFKGIVKGEVKRFEVPNLNAFNFVLCNALGGGANVTLHMDITGRSMHTILFEDAEIEFGEDTKL